MADWQFREILGGARACLIFASAAAPRGRKKYQNLASPHPTPSTPSLPSPKKYIAQAYVGAQKDRINLATPYNGRDYR